MIGLIIFIVLTIVASGGVYYYYQESKKLAIEFKEFMQVTFEALKDRKITIAEKERMLKEYADLKPHAKKIKSMFIDDANELVDEIKETYEKIKAYIKDK